MKSITTKEFLEMKLLEIKSHLSTVSGQIENFGDPAEEEEVVRSIALELKGIASYAEETVETLAHVEACFGKCQLYIRDCDVLVIKE